MTGRRLPFRQEAGSSRAADYQSVIDVRTMSTIDLREWLNKEAPGPFFFDSLVRQRRSCRRTAISMALLIARGVR